VHVWSVVLPEQRVWPGPQTPPQLALLPATRQVVLEEQATGDPHVPVDEHVDTPLVPPHWVEPGEQTPWHCAPSEPPITQAWFGQVTAGPQLPPLQVWMADVPEH
jgi:hypothetical protein